MDAGWDLRGKLVEVDRSCEMTMGAESWVLMEMLLDWWGSQSSLRQR